MKNNLPKGPKNAPGDADALAGPYGGIPQKSISIWKLLRIYRGCPRKVQLNSGNFFDSVILGLGSETIVYWRLFLISSSCFLC